MSIFIVTCLLFFLPLLVLPFTYNPFEVPKIILAQIGIWVLLFLVVWQNPKAILDNLDKKRISLLVGLFGLSIIHLVFLKGESTFLGNQFRLQGIWLLWNLIIFALISSSISLQRVKKWVFSLSFFGLFLSSVLLFNSATNRSIGTLGEPNALAGAALFLWPFSFFTLKMPYKLLSFFGAFLIIFLADSRSGLIAFSLQILIFILVKKLNVSYIKSFLIVVILLTLSLIFPILEGGGWYENRGEIWSTAFSAGLSSPIIGNGFGNIAKSLENASLSLGNNVHYQFVDSAHNFLLDFWVQGGAIGLGLILILLFLTIQEIVRQKDLLRSMLLTGLLAVMLFNPVSVVTLISFWWLIGFGLVNQDHPNV